MSKIKICDRCKDKIEYGFKIKTSSKYIDVNNKIFHLCDDCFEDYYNIFRTFLRGNNNGSDK